MSYNNEEILKKYLEGQSGLSGRSGSGLSGRGLGLRGLSGRGLGLSGYSDYSDYSDRDCCSQMHRSLVETNRILEEYIKKSSPGPYGSSGPWSGSGSSGPWSGSGSSGPWSGSGSSGPYGGFSGSGSGSGYSFYRPNDFLQLNKKKQNTTKNPFDDPSFSMNYAQNPFDDPFDFLNIYLNIPDVQKSIEKSSDDTKKLVNDIKQISQSSLNKPIGTGLGPDIGFVQETIDKSENMLGSITNDNDSKINSLLSEFIGQGKKFLTYITRGPERPLCSQEFLNLLLEIKENYDNAFNKYNPDKPKVFNIHFNEHPDGREWLKKIFNNDKNLENRFRGILGTPNAGRKTITDFFNTYICKRDNDEEKEEEPYYEQTYKQKLYDFAIHPKQTSIKYKIGDNTYKWLLELFNNDKNLCDEYMKLVSQKFDTYPVYPDNVNEIDKKIVELINQIVEVPVGNAFGSKKKRSRKQRKKQRSRKRSRKIHRKKQRSQKKTVVVYY